MVVVKSDGRNQAYTRCYLEENVTDGFPNTETIAPPKNSSNNHCRTFQQSDVLSSFEFLSFHKMKTKLNKLLIIIIIKNSLMKNL